MIIARLFGYTRELERDKANLQALNGSLLERLEDAQDDLREMVDYVAFKRLPERLVEAENKAVEAAEEVEKKSGKEENTGLDAFSVAEGRAKRLIDEKIKPAREVEMGSAE